MILDEPTNDLDVEMLEVLEEQLVNYKGTLIVVSHDRDFLDNVVTSTLVFEAAGRVEHYVGGYSDWLKMGKSLRDVDNLATQAGAAVDSDDSAIAVAKPVKKLSYKLQRELDAIPLKIEELESEISELETAIAAPGFYQQEYSETESVMNQLSHKQAELDKLLERWEELEG